MSSLGTLGGSESIARDINDLGYIVGTSQLANGQERAFIYGKFNGMTNIGTLGGDRSRAISINNSNEIAGWSYIAGSDVYYAYKWDTTNSFLNLGNLGGNHNFAEKINDLGQIVGGSRTYDNGATHAFFWNSLSGMTDIANPFGGVATGINELSQVVGFFYNNSTLDWHLFLWDATNGFQDLNIVNQGWGTYYTINDSGLVVGKLINDTAVIYDSNTNTLNNLIDLIPEDSGWESLEYAFDINSSGQIVGSGIKDGEQRAYLLNPVAAVPEPCCIFLFGFGAFLIHRFGVIKKC